MNYYCSNITSLLSLIGFFCLFIHFMFAQQDQRVADSLEKIYNENKLEGTAKLELLRKLAFNEINDSDKALGYADELIELSESLQDNDYLYSGHLMKGYKYRYLGKYNQALTEFLKCIDIANTLEDLEKQGTANTTVADINNELGNISTAVEYYNRAIKILSQTNDSISLAITRLNLGDAYLKDKEYDKAEQMFEKSLPTFKKNNNKTLIAFYNGNIGMAYAGQRRDSLAESKLKEAITVLVVMEIYSPVCTYLISLSEIYARKGDMHSAFNYANRSLDLAKNNGLNEQISEANLKLSELYESVGNDQLAFDYSKKYRTYRDSLHRIESNNTADLLRTYEVQQKQTALDLSNQKRKTQKIIVYSTGIALFLIMLLAIGLFHRYKYVRATNEIITTEKQRSDNLLLNILPEDTAQELKDRGKVQAKRFESVTVLFTDFENFTIYAEQLPPEQVVTAIDYYFSKFDEIIGKYGLEKIKTVGDAYMCAGGLPTPTKDHAYNVILAAFEIINFVDEVKRKSNKQLAQFNIRIGINSGPVVAGVVGSKKFAYDIWGDSVNIASRMESASTPGKINISENTYQLVKDRFNCKFRGKIEVKNRGVLKMYFVNSIKSFKS